MKRLSFVLALILSLLTAGIARAGSLPAAKPEQVGLSSERLDRMTQVLRNDVERGRIAGAVVVVARQGRVAYAQAVGFRDKAANAPMTQDAIFRIASMTKPLVTVAAMSLYEEGRLLPSVGTISTCCEASCRRRSPNRRSREEHTMPIVDAQVHIWSGGKPRNPNHRQVDSFSKDELRDLRLARLEAGVIGGGRYRR